MRNDTIDFIFSDAEASDPKLDPEGIAELARSLESMFAILLAASVPQDSRLSVKAYIVAIHRGSAIVSFLIDLLPDGVISEIKNSPLSSLNNALDIIQHLTAISLGIAVHLKLAKPERAEAQIPSDPSLMGQLGERLLANNDVRRQVEAMVRRALSVGPEQVMIRAPGETPILLSHEGSTDIRLVGSAGRPAPASGPFDGSLCIGLDELTVMFANPALDRQVTLYNGFAIIDGNSVPVVVEWNSARDVPKPQGSEFSDFVHVKGSVLPIQGLFNQNSSSRTTVQYDGSEVIPTSFRVASAFVIVETQRVEE